MMVGNGYGAAARDSRSPFGRQDSVFSEIEEMDRLLQRTIHHDTRGHQAPPSTKPPLMSPNEVERAVELVHDAAEAIRTAEYRVAEAERHSRAVIDKAAQEVLAAEARAANCEARIRTLETQQKELEDRAREAEMWLRQIYLAVTEQLDVQRPANLTRLSA